MKTKIQILLLLTIININTGVFASPVDQKTAKTVATRFMQGVDSRVKSSEDLSLVYTRENAFFVFGNQSSWIMVASQDIVGPILAYSTEGAFVVPEDTVTGTNFWAWINNYETQIKHLVDNKIPATKEIANQWQTLLLGTEIMGIHTPVLPLMTTTWNQTWPYNALCPPEPWGPGGHALVGCVGVAMGQIMKYHNWPAQGVGYYGYQWGPSYTGANFGQTQYNFTSMSNSISTMNTTGDTAVARLLYHTALACRSMWGAGSTGVGYSGGQEPMTRAWVNYFQYAYSTMEYVNMVDYTQAQWHALIQSELNANRPVYYSGDSVGSHAFVCDGVDANNLYHFNWGWGGMYNGYFALGSLNPGSSNFTNHQDAIIGIKPNDGSTITTNTLWSGNVTRNSKTAVADGITLTVAPGTTVQFSADSRLQVFGTLLAIGDSLNYVKFTAIDTALGWHGIKFDNGYLNKEVMADNDTSRFVYAQVEYSKSSGIYSYFFGRIIVDNCKINNNSAEVGAGLSIWFNPINITNSQIYNNHATIVGGGIFFTTNDTLSAIVSQNNIYDNLADADGGGFFFHNITNVKLEKNIFRQNQAGKGAGGATMFGSPLITNNIFINNSLTASNGRGVLYLENCSTKVINNLIANNLGNGITVENSSPIIINTTIVNNNHQIAGGIVFDGVSTAQIKNCIIYGNYANNAIYGHQIAIGNNNSNPVFDHCNIQGGATGFGGPGSGVNYPTANYTNNIDTLPLFVAPSLVVGITPSAINADWRLQSTSPCINTGDTTGISSLLPAFDLGGGPRIIGTIDMGAYEFCQAPVQVSNISGDTNPCQFSTQQYWISGSTNTSYTWTVPNTWNIISGQGTDTINVFVGTETGNITIIPSNICGNGPSTTLAVNVNTIPSTVSISGNLTPCESSNQIYMVNNTLGTNYHWTVPNTWNIISGQGTNQLNLTVSNIGGTISVTPSNICGNGTVAQVQVQVQSLPTTPSAPTGPDTVNSKTTPTSVYYTNMGATYTWELIPANAGNVSQINESVTITWNPGFVGTCSLRVQSTNNCGQSTWSYKIIYVDFLDNIQNPENTINIKIFPNPSSGIFQIEGEVSSIDIFDNLGRLVLSSKNHNKINLTGFGQGIYYAKIQTKCGKTTSVKLIVQ